jgi:tetratricopeptide (TPR) repeat protein
MSRYLLGKSYIDVGRYNDAVAELDKSIALKDNFAPVYFELGNAYYKKFDFNSARANYMKAIQYDSKLIDAYNNLGAIQIALGALGEAEKNLMVCIRIDPAYAAAYKNLGILYDTKMGNAAKAVENYNTYLKLRPNCPERNLVKMWISALKN